MLVLKRKSGEQVIITTPEGREIVIEVVSQRNTESLRIGFRADPEVTIDRKEVHDAKLAGPSKSPVGVA